MSLRQRDEHECSYEDSYEDSYDWQPAPKKRRLRGRQGGLENLPHMPLDIIIEVMGYLKPLDLLNLARTSRDFRSYLMARSAAPLWKSARKNIEGLPDCPPHLSEPEYANLVFDAHCHSCLRPGTKTILWQFGARYCADCKKFCLVPCNSWECPSSRSDSCLNLFICYRITEDKNGETYWHHEPEIREFEAKCELGLDDDAVNALVQRNIDIMEHARLCEEWQQVVQDNRQQEIEELRERRCNAIMEKVEEYGYGEELNLMVQDGRIQGFLDLPFVKQPKELTARMWNNGKDEILEYMDDVKHHRLYQERGDILRGRVQAWGRVYNTWKRTQPNKSTLPRLADLLCHDLLIADITTSFTLIDDSLAPEVFSPLVETWRHECDSILRLIVRASPLFRSLGVLADTEPLSLAAVVFSCTECGDDYKLPPLYPSVITHSCCYTEPSPHSWLTQIPGIDDQLANIMLQETNYSPPWTMTFELGLWHKRAVQIIKACGQDPAVVTREEMDALRARLWCTWCSEHYSAGDIRQVMTWRDAFNHYIFHDKRNGKVGLDYANDNTIESPLKWACMFGDEIANIRVMEDEHARDHYSDLSKRVHNGHESFCGHCDVKYLGMGYRGLKNHLRSDHGIEEPIAEDFYQYADAEPYTTRPVIIVRRERRFLLDIEDVNRQVEVVQWRTGCDAPAYLEDF